MNTEETTAPHTAWVPYNIDAITGCNEGRTGFIGRSVAVVLDGIEVVVMTKTTDDLAAALASLRVDLDESRVYRTTLIQSEGIDVSPIDVPITPVVPEEKPAPPIVPEVPVEPTAEQHGADVALTAAQDDEL